jgi:hypothetical protein
VMSAREGSQAARSRLDGGVAKGATGSFAVQTGSLPIPPAAAAPPHDTPAPGQTPSAGVSGFLRRIFARGPEARQGGG